MTRAPIFEDAETARRYILGRGATRVILANGCFDPLHVGHVRYLKDARSRGDFLVVALNDDASTSALKGRGRPVVSAPDRAAILAALCPVDAVVVFGEPDVVGLLEQLNPACHAKGTDYTVDTVPEHDAARRLGIETVIAGDPKTHASRDVIRAVRKHGDEASWTDGSNER